jgi:hypothetical protein
MIARARPLIIEGLGVGDRDPRGFGVTPFNVHCVMARPGLHRGHPVSRLTPGRTGLGTRLDRRGNQKRLGAAKARRPRGFTWLAGG